VYSAGLNTLRRIELQRLFSTFPGGLPGLGLLLLRAAIGFAAVAEAGAYLAAHLDAATVIWVVGVLSVAGGALLVVGFLTPFAGAAIGFCIVSLPFVQFNGIAGNLVEARRYALLALVADVAIVLLGPGAFSLDARLFGRREIVIPRGSERS
jgi:uncharacterized membrane protein YphA (DoxX/SURF4 family)